MPQWVAALICLVSLGWVVASVWAYRRYKKKLYIALGAVATLPMLAALIYVVLVFVFAFSID